MNENLTDLPHTALLERQGKNPLTVLEGWAKNATILGQTGAINYDPGRVPRLEPISGGRHFWDLDPLDSTNLFQDHNRSRLVGWIELLSTRMTQDELGKDLGEVNPISYIDNSGLVINYDSRLSGVGLANFREGLRQIFSEENLDYLETRASAPERTATVLLLLKVAGIIPYEQGEIDAITMHNKAESGGIGYLEWIRRKVQKS
ncbi:hypothetical protein A3C98_00810 [Candidatus Roizmanbacteria bacterium RIFCSPHIGHO2_02_FULL_37_15]|uniref:Uncharacterized protein n=1 Tax=Candidatus Roizmanbacteria bacterium RIFCSPLOWO2_01_FULL_37_16 TaxID=1802058 RepID=A0A1F7IMV5_9BACT|nr:MAG: hypothetical protein A2859_03805 [Candidatus Roizmanbacteria bacterium RIFCSPHIGHO2_01_FULL_37_16b]OGK21364.1 MAG: hypothetical protein A3C98_00810 [Candidatus Roizmanbacteria bacterium RIFCSPHIGHO2_02_FULL_37_15]OGK33374.1 MAG: hypothetical protein A3F57_01805 [Candidatus Roizmanbacteria bacterium RIFCSPHIGHO2_12_FULL_36_11]OGK44632.1 MAG: hypothetical protein A3B40_02815 [Candidatus Roizmanbacteria bacterium RIFCSPLOWO2_01_FULL_37_16]OGK56807.1 MAG: hypothetical protein A3I50_02255 [C